jgi:hypothetical protein
VKVDVVIEAGGAFSNTARIQTLQTTALVNEGFAEPSVGQSMLRIVLEDLFKKENRIIHTVTGATRR